MERIIKLLVLIGLLLIAIGIVSILAWKLDEARCYNMPLNEVYNDKLCQLHTETYEEMNRR